MRRIFSILFAIVVIVAAILLLKQRQADHVSEPAPTATATFYCDAGKTIAASFYAGAAPTDTKPGEPPRPGGSVELLLSDGRTLSLDQTISGSGARYANPDESIVFWNKGDGLTFTENGAQTYMGCIAAAPDPGTLPQVYENGSQGFSIRMPADYSVNDTYSYQGLGPGKDIGGVSFVISSSTAAGTNLGADSYVSFEEIPQVRSCSADLFIYPGVKVSEFEDAGTTYSFASSTDAGAGNRYEEWVFAMPGTNPCKAIRYFIHYSVFENYPPGSVTRFDEPALVKQFDAIRHSVRIVQ